MLFVYPLGSLQSIEEREFVPHLSECPGRVGNQRSTRTKALAVEVDPNAPPCIWQILLIALVQQILRKDTPR